MTFGSAPVTAPPSPPSARSPPTPRPPAIRIPILCALWCWQPNQTIDINHNFRYFLVTLITFILCFLRFSLSTLPYSLPRFLPPPTLHLRSVVCCSADLLLLLLLCFFLLSFLLAFYKFCHFLELCCSAVFQGIFLCRRSVAL